jgi:hypothetical protein
LQASYAKLFEEAVPMWFGHLENLVAASATDFVAGTVGISVADYLVFDLLDTCVLFSSCLYFGDCILLVIVFFFCVGNLLGGGVSGFDWSLHRVCYLWVVYVC